MKYPKPKTAQEINREQGIVPIVLDSKQQKAVQRQVTMDCTKCKAQIKQETRQKCWEDLQKHRKFYYAWDVKLGGDIRAKSLPKLKSKWGVK